MKDVPILSNRQRAVRGRAFRCHLTKQEFRQYDKLLRILKSRNEALVAVGRGDLVRRP